METAISRQDDGTIELTVAIPWKKVKESFDDLFKKALSGVQVGGFRKGKAPKNLAQDKIDKEKVYQEVVKEIIPKFYLEAVKEQNLRPIISPKVSLIQAKEGQDWQFKATLCEKPEVRLGEYQKAVQQVKREQAAEIWVPGKEGKSKEKEKKKVSLDKLLKALLKSVEIKIPEILLEEEVNRQLANLLDQTQKLGLTAEQYLKAKGKTIEQLKREYQAKTKETLKLEFALEKIADQEKITVEEKEIDALISKEKDQKIRDQLKSQRYYLASLLRRQKTLDTLLNL